MDALENKKTFKFYDDNNLEYKLKMLTTFIDNSEAGMYVTDYYTGEILFANRKMLSFGENNSIDEIIGKICWKLINYEGGERCSFCPYKKLVGNDGELLAPYSWEHYFPIHGIWLKIVNQAIIWADGRLAHMVTFYDATESKLMHERLADLAYKDKLLGLENEKKLEQDILNAQIKPSLIILDLVSLQKVNHAYGREIGDKLLMAVRDYIFELNIPNSNLYRIGGDEFCITIEHDIEKTIQSLNVVLLKRLREPWIFESNDSKLNIFMNATIGVILSDYVYGFESLMNLIERTLQEAKNGKKIVIYNEVMNTAYKKRLQLEMSLKRSVRENMEGFEVFYQPIASSAGSWCGLEALCRWNSTEMGPVSPLTFIAEAERLSLIGSIGLWVLETAILQCKEWELDTKSNFILNVNFSAVQFLDEMLAENILAIIQKFDYPTEKLCVEITESTQFTFTDLSLRTIRTLRSNNIKVALDDFGTGYSNFNNLKNLPVDTVKIERDFTMDIETNTYHKFLFEAMVEIAHNADKKLIAEGVENDEQMRILVTSGADFLQGYRFSKPLTAKMMECNLKKFNN